MLTPIYTPATVNAGQTKVILLPADGRRLNNTISVSTGTSGTLSFRVKTLFGQWDTPETPNTLNLATHKHIMFNGAALEALEVTNSGATAIDLVITQV